MGGLFIAIRALSRASAGHNFFTCKALLQKTISLNFLAAASKLSLVRPKNGLARSENGERKMNYFVFDLDSTLTKEELLPKIAQAAGMQNDMAQLTQKALDGAVPFAQSFRARFNLLKHLPLPWVLQVANQVEFTPHLAEFILANNGKNGCQCIIATGNVDIWTKPITDKLGCRVFASHAEIENGVLELKTVLDKADVMQTLLAQTKPGEKIIAVGDSYNDIPMFEAADVSVAFGGVNQPVAAVREKAMYFYSSGKELAAFLASLI